MAKLSYLDAIRDALFVAMEQDDNVFVLFENEENSPYVRYLANDLGFLGKKVFLETYVKTLKNWRDQEKYFIELGLKDEDE